ncbi:MAG TPA: glycosyltransferase family 2 protein, partial [Acidimicrobiales bacterium]|nr:glycosyltransferase family 2 protein [Acidimicrobiales bacterium]
TEPADADLLAFLDADTVLDPADPIGWLVAIAAHFHDERVGLVAPRVQAAPPVPGRGAAAALGRYEGQESPLDLGPEPGRAGAGRRLSYVPAAAIVVRRRALAEVGWFDEDLRFGEDVDLVRRLDRAGWTVRYEPSVIVLHDSRGSWRAFARQRAGYGSSAAELHARHPGTVPPFAAPPLPAFAASAAAVAAVAGVSGRSRSASAAASAAVAATLVASARLRKAMARVGAERPLGPAVRVAAASTAGALVGLLSALRRGWWPALLPLAGARRARRGTLALLGASTVAGHLRPAIAAAVGEGGAGERARRVAVHLAIGVLDDAAYTAGVWQGCWRRRSLGALAPSVRRRRRLPRGR